MTGPQGLWFSIATWPVGQMEVLWPKIFGLQGGKEKNGGIESGQTQEIRINSATRHQSRRASKQHVSRRASRSTFGHYLLWPAENAPSVQVSSSYVNAVHWNTQASLKKLNCLRGKCCTCAFFLLVPIFPGKWCHLISSETRKPIAQCPWIFLLLL